MAVVYNARGTSIPYFTIGKKGTTIYQGSTDPSGTYTVKDGDLWIDTATNSLKLRNLSSWDSPSMGNLQVSGNTLSSTDTDGDISLDPDGSGKITMLGQTEFQVDPVITNTQPKINFLETDASSNEQAWQVLSSGGSLFIRTATDALGAGTNLLSMGRSGTTPTNITLQTGQFLVPDGSVSTPPIAFSGNTNTGIFNSSGGGAVGFTVNGTIRTEIGEQGVNLTQDGSESSPCLYFQTDQTTGLFKYAADTIGFTTNGTTSVSIDTQGLSTRSTSASSWASTDTNSANDIVTATNASATWLMTHHNTDNTFRCGIQSLNNGSDMRAFISASSYTSLDGSRFAINSNTPSIHIRDLNSTGDSINATLSFRDSANTEEAVVGFDSGSNKNFTIQNNLGLIELVSATADNVTSTANANAGSGLNISAGDGGNSVDGTAGDGGDVIVYIGAHGTASGTGSNGTEGDFLVKAGDGSTLLTLNSTGAVFSVDVSATDLINTSSRRYKKDIEDFTDLDRFANVRPVFYRRKDTNKEEIGFIAEEMFEQYPELVHFNKEGEIEGIDYGKMTAILTAKAQEQEEIIESQQKEIDSLSARLAIMEEAMKSILNK